MPVMIGDLPDPEPPQQLPDQHTSSTPCPTLEPTASDACHESGKECDYPVCWGAANKAWVCVQDRWTLWFDESFKCAPDRPCPTAIPMEGTACRTGLSCYYPIDCCGTVAGFVETHCYVGTWEVRPEPTPSACPLCAPFPNQGAACSLADACTSGPPAVCYRPTCYGGTDVARCDGTRWQVTVGCSK
jgi:hypothetical protein